MSSMSAMQDDAQEDPSDEKIFEGTKFWVSHRVPTRRHIIELINTHGGHVVPLEKRADILIADHARKDCPPDSFSWRFVVESAKEGHAKDLEPYRIGPPSTDPRPIASAGPLKPNRTPFTTADDVLLTSWVHARNHNCGNSMYMDLETAHPHHTWQSWRSRWVKKLRLLPDNVLEQMISSHDSEVQNPPAPATPKTRPQRQATTPPPQPAQPAIPSPAPRKLRRVSPAVREKSPAFDGRDDALLERYVKAKVGSGEMWNNISTYEGLSENHPRHSAKSWKMRFVTLWRDNRVSMKDWNSTSRPAVHRKTDTRSAEAGSQAGNGAISPARKDASPERVAMPPSQESEEVSESDDPKDLFYSHLRIWLDTEAELGRTWDVAKWHRVQGRNIELRDLYEAVLGQKCSIEDVDWDLVAETMGFDWLSSPGTAGELKGCWAKYLARFHDDTAGFEFAEDTEAPDEEAHDVSSREGTPAPRDDAEAPNEDAYVSSGRECTPTPRSARSPSLSDRAPPVSQPQKRRLSRDVEIFSTPQSKLRPGSARRAADPTPSKRRRLYEDEGEGAVDSAPVGDEDFYDATPTHRRLVPQEAPSSRSPAAARPRTHQKPTTSGGVAGISGRRTERQRTALPTSAPSPRPAARRHALPPAVRREPDARPAGDGAGSATPADNGSGAAVDAVVERFIREGYSRPVIFKGLFRTSLDASLTRGILAGLAAGGAVPAGLRGVWTEADDDALKAVDAVDMSRPTENVAQHNQRARVKRMGEELVRKHGSENVDVRRRFLRDVEECPSER